MMTDREILLEMLQEEILTPVGRDMHGRPIVELQEDQQDNPVISTIRKVPLDAIVIRADKFPAPIGFLKSSDDGDDMGMCKRADFVIISEEESVVLYIELKSGDSSAKEIVQQLKGASCVIAYCKEVARQFWNKEDFLDSYDCRYIRIVEFRVKKRRTRPKHTSRKQSIKHDSPESFLTIRSPHHLKFNKLAA